MGFLDPRGDLFLLDRVKELIIVSGFNVYPVEVEDLVHEVAGVREVAVVGAPDSRPVRPSSPTSSRPGVDADARPPRARPLQQRLARFKRPAASRSSMCCR